MSGSAEILLSACLRQAGSGRQPQRAVLLCFGGQCDDGEGEAFFAPGIEAALERADALDAIFSEEQRHTGAGGFVRSSTVKNHFAIARQEIGFILQLEGVHSKGAGNGFRIGFEVH